MPPNDRTTTTYNDYETPAEVSLATNPLYRTHEGEHHGDFSGVSIRVTKSTILYAFCAAMNSCNLGYDIGVSTNAGQLIQNDFGLTDTQREIFVGSLNFFSIFGSAFSHWISDRFGRRRSFQVAALTFIVGLVIMSFSKNFTVLMVGRAILGLAVGFGLAIDPLYISEISTAAHRGELVTWSEMAINVGIVLGFFSGIVFYGVEDGLEWRLMLLCGCILPIAVIVLSRTVMVESPRYLVGKGLDDEAKDVLRTMYPPGFDVEPIAQDIKEAIEREEIAEQNVGWNVILFPTPAIRRMLFVGIGTAIAQQAVGIDAIQYYLIDVLRESGIESDKAQLGVLMLLAVLKLMFVVVSSKLLDRRGRRPLLFISLIGMSISLVLISFSFASNNIGPAFAVTGLCLYLSFFSIGIGPIAWLIPSEIFATSIRAKAMSLATFFNRITGTLMASTFLSTAKAIGWTGFFIMLAVICIVICTYLYFLLPETRGRSLEDMSLFFAELTGDTYVLEAEKKIVQKRQSTFGRDVELTQSQTPSHTGEVA